MMAKSSFALMVLILIISEQKVVGLNCYHCAFGRDGCGTSFNSKGSGVIQQTSSSYTYCVKQVYSSNTNAISRDGSAASACSAGTISMAAVTSGSISDGYTVYCCNTDLCNESSMKSVSIVLTILTALLKSIFV